MAVSGPQNAGIPGYTMFKPKKPKPVIPTVVGPQNVGLPGYRPGDPGNPMGAVAPPAPVAAAAPPPPPINFNALIAGDAGFNTTDAELRRQNKLSMDTLSRGFAQTAQGHQDNANSRGALFSGAAVNAQRSNAQDYERQAAAQAGNLANQQNRNYLDVWQRLIQQLAGGQ